MQDRKHRLGLISLCVTAALGLMALSAAAAQAEKPAWMIGGTSIEGTAERTVNLKITPETASGHPAILLSHASGATVAIQCEKAESISEKILHGGVAHGTVNFTECNTKLNGSPAGACKPKEPISAAGLLLIVLHEGRTVILAEPASGKPFTTITLGTEEECSVGENFDITGTGWAEDCNNEAEVEKLVHLGQEATAAAAALGGLKFGLEKANIDGSGTVELLEGGVAKLSSALAA